MRMFFTVIIVLFIFFLLFTLMLYFLQTKLIFFPEKLPETFQFSFDERFEEKNFETAENVRINALHFKADNPRGIIFYFHGNAGSLRGWGDIAGDFLLYQYDVLIFDYRSYGKSTGQISETGLHKDAQYIYDDLKNIYDEKKIVIYGRSIGTGIATPLAYRNDPGMLILESPFYNLPDLAKRYFPWVPRWMIRYQFRNDKYIKKVNCPVYIIHGSEDEVINVAEGKKLAYKLKPKDRFTLIEGGHHNDLRLYEEYHRQMENILGR